MTPTRLSTPAFCRRVALAAATLSPLFGFAANPVASAAAASAPPYALFGGKPLEWERSGGKIVGVYVPNWQPTALVDGMSPLPDGDAARGFRPMRSSATCCA